MHNLRETRDSHFHPYGLPEFTRSELVRLMETQETDNDEEGNITMLGQMVVDNNPELLHVIDYDIGNWLESEHAEELSEAEKAEYAIGLREGYATAFGSFAYVSFLATEAYTDFEEYLEDCHQHNSDIYVNEEMMYRMIEVIAGRALVEESRFIETGDSTDMAERDGQDILNEESRITRFFEDTLQERKQIVFERFVDEYEDDEDDNEPAGSGPVAELYEPHESAEMSIEIDPDDLIPDFESLEDSFQAGFMQGSYNAIELLIQLDEQQLLEKWDEDDGINGD